MRCEGAAWGRYGQVRVSEYVWGLCAPVTLSDRWLSSRRYFGFITKHPADHRFACHVFVSEESTKALAESVGYGPVCVCLCVSCRAPGPRASPRSPPSSACLMASSPGGAVLRTSSPPGKALPSAVV